jgi:hypothetical protein
VHPLTPTTYVDFDDIKKKVVCHWLAIFKAKASRPFPALRMAAESFLMRWQESGHPKRFRFLNAEQFGTIRAVQHFNRSPLGTAGNRLQYAV